MSPVSAVRTAIDFLLGWRKKHPDTQSYVGIQCLDDAPNLELVKKMTKEITQPEELA